MPTQLETATILQERFPRSTIEEVIQEPYFDEFWEKYNHKHDKVMALKAWDKMKPFERYAAYINIDRYNRHLKRSGVAKLYPVRYLTRRTWENDLGK